MPILTNFLAICVLAIAGLTAYELKRTKLQQQMYSEQTDAMVDLNQWMLENTQELNSAMHQITEDHHELDCTGLLQKEKFATQAAESKRKMAHQLANQLLPTIENETTDEIRLRAEAIVEELAEKEVTPSLLDFPWVSGAVVENHFKNAHENTAFEVWSKLPKYVYPTLEVENPLEAYKQLDPLPEEISEDGNIYIGQWKNGLMDGRGILLEFDEKKQGSSIYEGYFKDGTKFGTGRLVTITSEVYEGTFQHGSRHTGKSTLPTGRVYEGGWTNGKRDGEAKEKYEDGSSYVGAFEGDRRMGQGVMTYADGKKYTGSWLKDEMHGQGSKTDKTGGVTESGIYQFGKKIR